MSVRKFYCYSEERKKYLEDIGVSFLDGYHNALIGLDNISLIPKLNENGKNNIGFAFEGAAMAKVILDFLGNPRKKSIKSFISYTEAKKHLYMLYVGAGWAYARLPINIEKRIEQYDPVLRWLIIDGYGFHQAFFKTEKYVYKRTEPKELRNEFSKYVFYQGVGRCLWFVEGADPSRISDRIKSFPSIYHSDLWSGVGLACTYAGGVEEIDIKQIRNLSGSFLPYLMQGSAFAAKARDRAEIIVPHVEMACQIICKMTVKEVSTICDDCLCLLPDNISSEKKYGMWRELIRTSIQKKSEHEAITTTVFN
jgi:hypothetical protein